MSGPLLTAATQRSAEVTHLGQRLVVTALCVLVLVGLALLMRRGWVHRGRRQSDISTPPTPPSSVLAAAQDPAAGYAGTYVSTTRAGDWLDRVVVHGLGVRASARVLVSEGADPGVLLAREGAPDVWVPAGSLEDVHLADGMAGKFVERGGLVVLRWHLGDAVLDTGFRPTAGSARDQLVPAIDRLLEDPK